VAVDNPFFLDSARTAGERHVPPAGREHSVSLPGIQARLDETDGNDPIFRPNDGSNSPLADIPSICGESSLVRIWRLE